LTKRHMFEAVKMQMLEAMKRHVSGYEDANA
jgi:hypothetical protein